MNQIDEAALAAYLDARDRRLYGRLLFNRFFQGTVVTVNVTTTPPQVQIQRVGESAPDANWYACSAAGYSPLVGDQVELVWRDDTVAHVAFPLTSVSAGTLHQIDLFASAGPALVGTLPAAPRFLRIAKSHVGTTNGSALLTVPFPSPFPNGLLNVVACPGDSAGSLTQVQIVASGYTTGQFQCGCFTPAGAGINNTSVRVNYEAVGF